MVQFLKNINEKLDALIVENQAIKAEDRAIKADIQAIQAEIKALQGMLQSSCALNPTHALFY